MGSKRNVEEGPDFYPTPAWATKALLGVEEFIGTVWEPACGDGAMCEVLSSYLPEVIVCTDLNDYGYGRTGVDFLQENRSNPNIITNPPFVLAEEFVKAGLRQSTKKLALLLRLAFLESVGRYKLFTEQPPSRVWIFSERVTFYPAGKQTGGSGTTAYAWFVWDKEHQGPTELKWIPPGYKTRSK